MADKAIRRKVTRVETKSTTATVVTATVPAATAAPAATVSAATSVAGALHRAEEAVLHGAVAVLKEVAEVAEKLAQPVLAAFEKTAETMASQVGAAAANAVTAEGAKLDATIVADLLTPPEEAATIASAPVATSRDLDLSTMDLGGDGSAAAADSVSADGGSNFSRGKFVSVYDRKGNPVIDKKTGQKVMVPAPVDDESDSEQAPSMTDFSATDPAAQQAAAEAAAQLAAQQGEIQAKIDAVSVRLTKSQKALSAFDDNDQDEDVVALRTKVDKYLAEINGLKAQLAGLTAPADTSGADGTTADNSVDTTAVALDTTAVAPDTTAAAPDTTAVAPDTTAAAPDTTAVEASTDQAALAEIPAVGDTPELLVEGNGDNGSSSENGDNGNCSSAVMVSPPANIVTDNTVAEGDIPDQEGSETASEEEVSAVAVVSVPVAQWSAILSALNTLNSLVSSVGGSAAADPVVGADSAADPVVAAGEVANDNVA